MGEPAAKVPKLSDLQQFDNVFPQLLADLTADLYSRDSPEIGDCIERFRQVLEFNAPHGKKNRGISVLHSYRFLAGSSGTTEEEEERAIILGWCVELLQAYFLVADDIMDQSKTRRGQPCWYRMKGVGNIAINDSFYLEAAIYELLRKYFRSESCYVYLVDLFHETTMQTVIGQGLDLITPPADGSVNFSRYTMTRYSAIVKWKTAFYSFYLPVALAMHMAGIHDDDSHQNAKKILLEMGHFFQVQDDYLDCYGDPAVTGKIGTDIEENKCGWLAVTALGLCTPAQRKVMEDNYARNEPQCVARVKALYTELDIQRHYAEYEEKSYQQLMQMIEEYSQILPEEMFIAFANKIYKRQK